MSLTLHDARSDRAASLPEPGTWVVDPAHSSIDITVRHLVAAKVRLRFSDFAGEIVVGETPEQSSASVEIRTASIDSRSPDRDAHLRSPDFFAVDEYPTARFRSVAVRPAGGDRYTVEGELTIRDVTRPVQLDVTYAGQVQDPWGNQRIVLSAAGEVDREQFGLTWNQALETGGVLVGRVARLEIDVEAVRQA